MADAIEVSLESALLDRLGLFTPAVAIAYPNVKFTPPLASASASYLRPTLLPAETATLTIESGANQHFGIFQIDVFSGQDIGELVPMRIVTGLIAWFKRGTTLTKNGYVVKVIRAPFRSRMIKDDPWIMISLSVPYIAFAPDPA